MKIYLTLSLFLIISIKLYAQNSISISGKIIEEDNGEAIIAANIFCIENSFGVVTNYDGEYELKIDISEAKDSITLVYSYIGFASQNVRFLPQKDTIINIRLSTGIEFVAIEVEAESYKEKLNSTQMGRLEVTADDAKKIPLIFGEVDVLKVFQLKPGVQSGGEGTSGLFIRGGSADQNLFLLDDAPIYNPAHLFGFFSTFNADGVENVNLYKAGFPAQYGGKLSGVVDVNMREGNKEEFKILGGIGMISSRLTFEGPIQKGKGSYIFSARRTYIDLITGLLNKLNKENKNWMQLPAYNFFDLNGKVTYNINDKNKVSISGFLGKDFFKYKAKKFGFNFDWGNTVLSAKWTRIIHSKMTMNTVATFSDYYYKIYTAYRDSDLGLGSGIRDYNFKSEFSYFPNNKHTIKFGVNYIYHRFIVNDLQVSNYVNNALDVDKGNHYFGNDFALYFNDDWNITERFKLNMGLRATGFLNDTKFYWGLEPRLSAKYSITDKMSLKANYARMYQYIHLVSSSGASFPTDVWYPSNSKVKPQFSDMVSLGYEYALHKDYYLSIEGYYKWLHNQIDFRDGANLMNNGNLNNEFIFGKGATYGIETYLEKRKGQWHGWIGYTLSWAWRSFPDIMNGKKFRPKYDRRHDFSIVLMYDMKKRPLSFSMTWVYGTGNAISLPASRYVHTDFSGRNPYNFIPIYEDRNSFRMPAYHRMDIGFIWRLKTKYPERFKSDLTFSIYNVYNRLNTFMIYIDAEYANDDALIPQRFVAKSIALFPMIPSVTWNFKF